MPPQKKPTANRRLFFTLGLALLLSLAAHAALLLWPVVPASPPTKPGALQLELARLTAPTPNRVRMPLHVPVPASARRPPAAPPAINPTQQAITQPTPAQPQPNPASSAPTLMAPADTAPAAPATATPAMAPISTDNTPPKYQIGSAANPRPPYPEQAREQGDEGSVRLKVWVDATGRPEQVLIERRSGSTLLDDSARRTVARLWRFTPAQRAGQAVPQEVLVTIVFRLTDPVD